MRGYNIGGPRTQCEACPTRNRYVRPTQVGKGAKNLCGPCRKALENILLAEAEAAAPTYVQEEEIPT